MIIIYFFTFLIFATITVGVILWLIKEESNKEAILKNSSESPLLKPSLSPNFNITPEAILKRVNLNLSKEEKLDQNSPDQQKILKNPTALTVTESPEERGVKESEFIVKYDELSIDFKELQAKYEKLSNILDEKNILLEKAEKNLNHEIKNRKDFNKVKDILEKELKEYRDKSKELQSLLQVSQLETQSSNQRNSQLEENITKLEKNLLAKDEEIKVVNTEILNAKKVNEEFQSELQKIEKIIKEKDAKIEGLVERLRTSPPAGQKNSDISDSESFKQQSVVEIKSDVSVQDQSSNPKET